MRKDRWAKRRSRQLTKALASSVNRELEGSPFAVERNRKLPMDWFAGEGGPLRIPIEAVDLPTLCPLHTVDTRDP